MTDDEFDRLPLDAESETQTELDEGASTITAQRTVSMTDTVFGETERLRQPRALSFQRRLRNQLGMLPLALFLFVLGIYLFVKERDITDLPDFSSAELAGFIVLAVAFTAIFHALLSGRRERGLLFVGLYVWVTAGLLAGLVYAIEDRPDPAEWWPLLIASLGVTLVLTFLIECTHDARLVLLSIMILVAAVTAYWITSGQIAEQYLSDATDYWPLLLTVAGIGLLPLIFRRTGQS